MPRPDRVSGHAIPHHRLAQQCRSMTAPSPRPIPSPPTSALIVAERRHSAVTRYAERSRACRDSTRPLLTACRRYATTPEPEHDRASGHAIPHHRIAQQSRSMTVPSPRHITADIRTHRRGATTLCHNPVRGAQRSVPGLDTPLLSACRRYATTASIPTQHQRRAYGVRSISLTLPSVEPTA